MKIFWYNLIWILCEEVLKHLELGDRSFDLMFVIMYLLKLLNGFLEIVDDVLRILGYRLLLSGLLWDSLDLHGFTIVVPRCAGQIVQGVCL